MAELTRRLDRSAPTAGPVLFNCGHRVYGVGMFDVATVLEGDAVVARAGAEGAPVDVLVGTDLGVPWRGESAASGVALTRHPRAERGTYSPPGTPPGTRRPLPGLRCGNSVAPYISPT